MTLRTTRVRRISAWMTAIVLVAAGVVVAPSAASAAVSGPLHTSGSRILTAGGQDYTIRAVSWFGLETSNCTPHGLWTISLESGLDRIAAMGFNTIRLPYSNECLAAPATNSINGQVNPTLVALTPLQLMDAVVSRAKARGLNVILDRHRPDSGSQSELWYTAAYSEQRWIDDWKMLATRYRDEPAVIGFDLHNEPRGNACWGCGDRAVDWRAAATRAGDAVLAVNPKLLIIVEGVERQRDGTSTWWGGGLKDAGAAPVTLAVANRVVYSPHDYPSTVSRQSWFDAPDYPANLDAIWEANWGYLQTKGIAPVLLGEFGTKLETASDRLWLDRLVGYLAAKRMGFAYWSFNPNSGDTGGLVADDWVTPQQAKLAALAPILTPGPAPTVSPTPTPTATPKPTVTPTPTVTPKPTSTPKPTATPTSTTTPKPPASPSPTATPTGGAVTATWQLQSAWGEGYVADFVVTAKANAGSWQISWSSPGVTGIVNSWGMDCRVANSVITCTGSGWTVPLAAGQTVRVGLQVAAPRAPSAPKLTVTSR